MFHKFQHYSFQHGFSALQEYASNWILSVLFCCYRSAQKLQERVNKYGHGIIRSNFFAADRILGIPGSSISAKEVLLAQGHEELQSLPLLVFSLIQCDPLRPNHGDFNPSLDARSAASTNMSTMTPDAIARCIAPRIELWSCVEETQEATSYGVGMNMKDIQNGMLSHFENVSTKNELPILFVDTPSSIILYDCQNLFHRTHPSVAIIEDLPATLKKAKTDALKSYRVTPQVYSSFSKHVRMVTPTSDQLTDYLIEDSITSTTHHSFGEWCAIISDILYSEITFDK